MVQKIYVTYNQVHKLCQSAAEQILNEFKPQLMVAIGGGGYVPARILRSFLKKPGAPNIPIQAIGLSLYESLGTTTDTPSSTSSPTPPPADHQIETPRPVITRTQWLDLSSLSMSNLIGKNILIVDEVDDTRTTLDYAVRELQKDVEEAQRATGREGETTTFSVFVLHNKEKEKKGSLPDEVMRRYKAARTVGDVWICYPWEAGDIEEHDRAAAEAEKEGRN